MNGGLEGYFRQRTADLEKARRALEDGGRDFWIQSIRTGEYVAGETLAALRTLGQEATAPTRARKAPTPAPQPTARSGRSYANGSNLAPQLAPAGARLGRAFSTPARSPAAMPPARVQRNAGSAATAGNPSAPASLLPLDDMAEFHRQQAEFAKITRDIGVKNSWFAIPALAPAAVVLGLEAAGAIGAEAAAPAATEAPFQFTQRDPHLRVGDNWATRAGRAAHEDFKRRVALKDGWDWEPPLTSEGGPAMRPDISSRKDMFMELKPNTPTGRRAGLRQVRRYRQATKRPIRVIYYDPSDYL